jgi:hypothetical protein
VIRDVLRRRRGGVDDRLRASVEELSTQLAREGPCNSGCGSGIGRCGGLDSCGCFGVFPRASGLVAWDRPANRLFGPRLSAAPPRFIASALQSPAAPRPVALAHFGSRDRAVAVPRPGYYRGVLPSLLLEAFGPEACGCSSGGSRSGATSVSRATTTAAERVAPKPQSVPFVDELPEFPESRGHKCFDFAKESPQRAKKL